MKEQPATKPDDESQSARFIETAKLVEADASGKKFTRALKVIEKTKPVRKKPIAPSE